MKKYLFMLTAVFFAAVSYAMIASGDREERVPDSQSQALPNATSVKSLGVKQGQVASSSLFGARKVQGNHEDMITEVPTTAEVKYYNRSGYYHDSDNNYAAAEQSGITAIAFDGNDVYIQNPIAGFESGLWVKGTIDGETITVPLGQFLTWSASYSYGLYLTMVDVDGSDYTNDTEATVITYTISGDVITQNGTSATRTLAVAWSDDDTVYAYGSAGGEYETVFTLDTEYVPTPTVLVELPDGATVEQWYAVGTNNGEEANVAFVGDEVYISGIFGDFPDSWIKGTISGSTVTFEKMQYLGEYSTYHIWAVAANMDSGDLEDIVMAYDAEAGTLTLDKNQALVANAKEDELYYLSIFYSMKLMKELPAPVSIDELPYTNGFDTEAEWDEFRVIDANSDGNTWAQYSKTARLVYSNIDDDDWLVSPLLKLEAGKTYKVSLQARCQSTSYPETFEVRAAKEQNVDALTAGLEVIPTTTVSSTSFKEYGNGGFTVSEDGYYCFGIHGTTVYEDAYYLYVDDFAVEEAKPTITTYYEKVTATEDLTDGEYLIVYEGDDTHDAVAFNGNRGNWAKDKSFDGAQNGEKVVIADGKIAATAQLDPDSITFTIDLTAGTLKGHSGQYIGVSSNSNILSQSEDATAYKNAFAIAEDGSASITAVFEGSDRALRFNNNIGQERFRYYKNTNQKPIALYKKIGETVEPEPEETGVVLLPEGAEVFEYNMAYINPSSGEEASKPINVAVVGNEVYFQGMSQYLPEAWVKGTLDGNQVTFAANQLMGSYGSYGESYFFYNGETVFTYDADANTYSTTGQIFGVLADQYYDGRYQDPVLTKVNEVAGVPATPTISGIEGTTYGDVVDFNIPTVDVNGNAMATSKLSYQFFVDDEETPLEFTTEYFSKLTENMTVIPYGFTEDYDFYSDYIYLNMPHDTWVRLGIQSIYTGGGEENKSEIFWFEMPAGPVEAPAELATETYIFKANALEYSSSGDIEHPDYTIQVEVGFDGDDAYIQGLANDAPELWVKATKNEQGQYVIPANQYMGDLSFWGYTFPYYWTALDAENNLVDAVLDYDAETNTFTTEQTLALNGAANALDYYLLFNDVTITKFVEMAATPATPTFESFNLSEEVGYTTIYASIPTVDTEGNALNTSKLFYKVWYEKDGQQYPYTFTAALYDQDFDEDVTEVPYSHDGYDIYSGGEIIYLEDELEELQSWTNVGIQSIYYGAGERRVSPIAWNILAKGDPTGDGEITTSDAVLTVSFALEIETPTEKQFAAADYNNSNDITVSDAVGIVNEALGKNSGDEAAPARILGGDNYLTLNGKQLMLVNSMAFVAFQMDVTLDNGAVLNGVKLSERAAGLSVRYNKVGQNTWRIIAMSLQNKAISGNEGTLLSLDITGQGNVTVSDVEFTDAAGCAYKMGSVVTGINSISIDTANGDIYTVNGVRANTMHKGMNIIRNANGEVNKVLVK